MIEDEVDENQLKESQAKNTTREQKRYEEEKTETKHILGTIVERYLTGQQDECEGEDNQKSIKALRIAREGEKKPETTPPWRTSSAAVHEAKKVLKEKQQEKKKQTEAIEKNQGEINAKALRNALSIAVARTVLQEDEDESSEEDSKSEEEFQPAKEGQ